MANFDSSSSHSSSEKVFDSFTLQNTFAEVLQQFPESQHIFFMYGLGCAGCSIAAFEILEDGFRAHGFTFDEMKLILDEVNQQFQNLHKTDSEKK